jgi:hypothetical protein
MRVMIMKTDNKIKICKNVRNKLYNFFAAAMSSDTGWIGDHIAHCPRCQRRLASLGRVHLALTLIKTQTHSPSLLKNANTMAISVLSKKLRNCPHAIKLKNIQVKPGFFAKTARIRSSLLNAAACLIILVLLKIGIFSSMETFQTRSKQVLKEYYVKNIGDDLTNQIFPS